MRGTIDCDEGVHCNVTLLLLLLPLLLLRLRCRCRRRRRLQLLQHGSCFSAEYGSCARPGSARLRSLDHEQPGHCPQLRRAPGHMLRVSQTCEHPEVIYKNATHRSSGWAEAHMLHGREVRTGEGQPGSLDLYHKKPQTSEERVPLEEADTAAHREGEERGEAGGASLRACPGTGGASPPRPARHRKVF